MSIAKLITDFITDSAKSATPVADLLEQARTIASVIEDNDFAKFCEKELNGYDEKDDVPDYRQIAATRQIWYDGPLLKPEDKRVAVGNHYTFSCRNPIKDISGVVASGKDYISAPWDDEEFRGYKNRNVIEFRLLQKLEIEVRKKINDWKTLRIKEGQFSLDSNRNAPVINNFGNINGANLIGSMVNSSAIINNTSADSRNNHE
jgi:hypothetical protein